MTNSLGFKSMIVMGEKNLFSFLGGSFFESPPDSATVALWRTVKRSCLKFLANRVGHQVSWPKLKPLNCQQNRTKSVEQTSIVWNPNFGLWKVSIVREATIAILMPILMPILISICTIFNGYYP